MQYIHLNIGIDQKNFSKKYNLQFVHCLRKTFRYENS